MIRTSYVRIPDPSMPDSHGGTDVNRVLNLKSGSELDSLDDLQQSKLPNPETPRPLSLSLGGVPNLVPPAHPNTSDLYQIRQEPDETVHHYRARFLLVMDRIKDCHEESAISIFCNNCTDKGIMNAISRREVTRFADLATIVRKYCAMESAWKTETRFWDNPALNTTLVRNKRVHHAQAPGSKTKKQ